MPKETFTYIKDDLTVLWKPNTCIHSKLCWKGLIAVFNPTQKPWINMDGASVEKIIEQVKKCPSGALSYHLNTEKPAENIHHKSQNQTTIEVSKNGPYLIKNECLIVHADGKKELKAGTIALCRCGASASKPYCDGSHRKIEFRED